MNPPSLVPSLRASPLEACCTRRLYDAFVGRAARLYGFGIAVSYGLWFAIDERAARSLLDDALGTLAMIVGGLLSLAAARDPRDSEPDGLLSLARQRGFAAREVAIARLLHAVRTITLTTGVPALVLTLVPYLHAETWSDFRASVLRTFGALGFVLALGVVLGGLARAAALAAPGRGRIVLLGLVVLPHVAHIVWPEVPSVPAFLSNLLGFLVRSVPA